MRLRQNYSDKILLLLIFAFTLLYTNAYALPSFDEVKASYKKSDAVLLDRHGVVINELRIDSKGRRLDWANLKDISPALLNSVIHSEDKRFYEHGGVDWRALGSAIIGNLLGSSKRGASTITMQLVSILEKDLRPKGKKRTLSQKWDQIAAARELEARWSKDRILEAYLNLVTFRSELQGIVAASRGLFGKEPSGLNEPESLLLASLIRSPNASSGKVASRACVLSESMRAQTGCDALKKYSIETFSGPYRITPVADLAPHVARRLLGEADQRVKSTIDAALQKFAAEVLDYQLKALNNQNVRDGALLVVDNKSGDILAYVANRGSSSSARFVDGIIAKRQAGSTLKPFLYSLAIERRLLTAASLLDDSPVNVPTPVGLYVPHNYDNDFKGPVSVRTALSSSLNVPAVRALMLVGPEDFIRRLRALGFQDLNEGDYYGLSMALGSVDVSLYELVNAYRSIANGGRWSAMHLKFGEKRSRSKQVIKPEAAFIASDILSDRTARGLTFGYENPLSTRFWTAVKTGTSKDMRDNWCIGFSGRYTVGVWVGNFSGESMWNVSGISGAAPVWLELMSYLHRSGRSKPPLPSPSVIMRHVEFDHSVEPARDEWFIRGTEPFIASETALQVAQDRMIDNTGTPTISYPPMNTIIALDPDIPDENNVIFFEASRKGDFDWTLDSVKIGSDSALISWKPSYGRHVLSIIDKNGTKIDSVSFEVRGSPLEQVGSDEQREESE